MESQEVLDTTTNTTAFHGNGGVNDSVFSVSKSSEGFEIVYDLDSMMEDIDTRLRIARMVSDSVIKGVVSAVEQEADEKIKAKEMEVASLIGNACFEDVVVKRDEMKDCVTDEFKRLRKCIEGDKGGCNIKRNGSCHEMMGLGGTLNEEYENGVGLEKCVDNLEMMMNNMSKLVDTVLIASKLSVNELKKEEELKGGVEEFQEAGTGNVDLAEKMSKISDLRSELESLRKLLPSNDSGHLISYSSFDVENAHANPLRSQLSSKWEENGEETKSKPGIPDSFEAKKFVHLNKEQVVQFFDNRIRDIRREHEAEMHELTDKYINLKGKYLSERRSYVVPNKDFEVLKRKIPEAVSKLNGILSESDEFIKKGESVASLSALFRENRQLRDTLAVKTDEVKRLSSQLSIVSEKNDISLLTDTSVIEELNSKIQHMKAESELEIVATHDIYKVLLGEAKSTCTSAIEDAHMESLYMQDLLEIVFKEALTYEERKFENLHKEYLTATENLVSLEKKATEMEAERILEAEEREKLTSEVQLLRNLVEETETLAKDELDNLRKQVSWQETLMSKTKKELDELSAKLSKAQTKLLSDSMEINSLNQKFAHAMEEIKALTDSKNMVLALSVEKQSFMSLIEAKEKEHRKQMEAIVVLVDELSTKFVEFECRVSRDVASNNARLANSRSELSSLIKAANVLKTTGIIYKQKLERKCSDLQMAEDEVDLLGDEVETLLGLLEKIYIALDHYSPVLQHYPGVR
ncbi:WPP domain-associated protein [Tanacetum coccineum]